MTFVSGPAGAPNSAEIDKNQPWCMTQVIYLPGVERLLLKRITVQPTVRVVFQLFGRGCISKGSSAADFEPLFVKERIFSTPRKKAIMKKIVKILGVGSMRDHELIESVEMAAREMDLPIDIQLISDIDAFLRLGITAIPAMMIEGKVVANGRIPGVLEIKSMLEDQPIVSRP